MSSVQFASWRGEQIFAQLQGILDEYGTVVGEEAKRQITEVKWQWDHDTLRFTSLFQGGVPQARNGGQFSPPTTRAGARNTRGFKARTSSGATFSGRGVLIPAGPRDIVDTGTLLQSQTAPQVQNKSGTYSMQIEWTAPYSGLVLKGGNFGSYINVNGREVTPGIRPGRNWIQASFQAQPFLPFLVERWNRAAAGA